MSPYGGYFTSLLNQEDTGVFGYEENEEVENEVMDSPPLNEMNSQSKPKGRSKNFSEAEDMLLISAYLNISTDAITGRDQKDGKYWERIENYFHESIERKNESGKTSNDKVI